MPVTECEHEMLVTQSAITEDYIFIGLRRISKLTNESVRTEFDTASFFP